MTLGVGGSNAEAELAKFTSMTGDVVPIDQIELLERVKASQEAMRTDGLAALYLDTSANLQYFTGLDLHPTERLHGAVIPADGPIAYLAPGFEEPKIRSMLRIDGEVCVWQEHEDPTALVVETIGNLGYSTGVIAIDPATPFMTFDGLRRAGNRYDFTNGDAITAACRAVKSAAEVALMDRANAITLKAQEAAARILSEGITTTEVVQFIRQAHRRLGASPDVVTVLFGAETAFPHGVDYPQTLKDGDMVLIDAVGAVEGYRSDITRSYVFGTPSDRQREIWNLEKSAQLAGFAAAGPGAPCHAVDDAARAVIEGAGFGADYALPGLPHRTGHGIGLQVHEERYIVRGNETPLAPGMCFSVEPTICVYGEFGIRLEDCALITDDGCRWFTKPSHTIDNPFGIET